MHLPLPLRTLLRERRNDMGQDSYWGLTAEKEYLDGLGSWGSSRRVSRNRSDLLRSYIETLHLRRYEPWLEPAWEYAKKLLKEES